LTEKKPKDGSFVIIPVGKKNHAFVVKQNYGKFQWSLPGGGVEKNQNFESAAIEEALQETGMEVELIKELGIFTARQSKMVVKLFEASPKLGHISFPGTYDKKEITEQGIISLDPPKDFPIFRAQRMFLQVYKIILENKIDSTIEDSLSAPFKNKHLQQWAEETKFYEEKP